MRYVNLLMGFLLFLLLSVGVNAAGVGGTTYTIGDYIYHVFTTSGTYNVTSNTSINILVVGGGGGAANYGNGGGGGAGGYVLDTSFIVTNSTNYVIIGGGGIGGAYLSGTAGVGKSGGNSSFYNITAYGGGGGAGGVESTPGADGGSGGGGAPSGAGTNGGSPVSLQGFYGGGGSLYCGSPAQRGSGGGGGASSNGTSVTGSCSGNGGNGGNGLTSTINGSSVVYAAGGGGHGGTTLGVGGSSGVGGNASLTQGTNGGSFGSGGGGGTSGIPAANGSRGIVIIKESLSQYFVITAKDRINSTAINVFNATINGTTYSTTNGTINTLILKGFGLQVNISIFSQYYFDSYTNVNTALDFIGNLTPYLSAFGSDAYDKSSLGVTIQYNGTNYTGSPVRIPVGNILFNATAFYSNYFSTNIVNQNGTNQNLNISMVQAYAYFNITEIISDSVISNYTVSTTNTSNSAINPFLRLKAGIYNITFNKTGWFNTTFQITVPAVTNQTYNNTAYMYLLNITAKNNLSGLFDSTFTTFINSTLYNYSTTLSTTNGSVFTPWINETYINITVYNTLTITNTTANFSTATYRTPQRINFTVNGYSTNTLFFNIYDEQRLTKIVYPVTLNLLGNSTQYNFSTTTGLYNATLLNPQTYYITASASGYFSRTYTYTLLNQTTAVQNIYLLNNTVANNGQAITFTVTDLSALPLEGVLITSQKLINSTFITVSSQYSDFAGQIVSSYDTTQFYNIIFSKSGYVIKTVTLKPIATGYTVRLVGNINSVFTSQLENINYSFNPLNYSLVPGVYIFNFTTISPGAYISSFGMIQDGISVSNTGNTGGTVNITLNLSSSNNNTKSYLFRYYIIDITGNTFNFTNSYTIFNNSISTNSSISESIRNANFSTGGGIILAVIITVVVLLVMSTFIAGAFLGVVLGIIAITLSALTLIPWTFGIMIALIMFFSAWARGR